VDSTSNVKINPAQDIHQAEDAVRELDKDGFDMKLLPIVGKGYHTEENVVGYYNVGDRMLYWGKQGAASGLCCLVRASFWSQESDHCWSQVHWLQLSSVFWKAQSLLAGFSALGAALVSIGIPNNSVIQYEASIKSGQFLIVAHGSPEEVEQAKALLGNAGGTKIESFPVYEPAVVNA